MHAWDVAFVIAEPEVRDAVSAELLKAAAKIAFPQLYEFQEP